MKIFWYNFYFFLSFFFFQISNIFDKSKFMFYFSLFENSFLNKNLLDLMMNLDWMKCTFLFVLFLISGSVGKFSLYYMSKDFNNSKFFYMLNLFMLSMVLLLILPYYIFFFIGWDGLGFTSFLLMKYYKSKKAWASSLKTFLINRFGDGLMLASMGMILYQGQFFFFKKINLWLLLFMLLGLLTKSAHFPFSSWLPAAMAAPTPVSALVHSSTLVTAGMYILIRFSYYFPLIIKEVLLIFAFITVFLGSLNALSSFDSKKIIAYSTLSNLGLLGVSIGCGFMGLSFFHLLAHGMSKALLFISTGKMMFKNFHFQDLRKFSKLWMNNSFILLNFMWSILSLMGFFFLLCFFSKDSMLEGFPSFQKNLCKILLNISLMFTFLYSFRLIFFFLKNNKNKTMLFKKKKVSLLFFLSMIFLFLKVLFFGIHFNYYIIEFFFSSKILKIYILIILIFCFLSWKKMNFKKILKFNFFKSSMFFIFSYLGNFFYNMLDLGSLSYFLNKSVFKFNMLVKTLKTITLKNFFFYLMFYKMIFIISMIFLFFFF